MHRPVRRDLASFSILSFAFSFVLALASRAVAAPFPVGDHFESAPVHPVEMSPDGTRLFVAHAADATVAIFDLTAPGGPQRIAQVAVGLEPVTVRARSNDEVWVVNHVSDSISIIKVSQLNVVRTLLVVD